MIITPLISKIRAALIADADLQIWGQLNFSKPVRVDVGLDPRKAPETSAYPLIALAGRRQQVATGRTRATHEFDFLVFVESGEVVTDDNGQVQKGFLLVGELRELATRALTVGAGAKVAAPEDRESEMRTESPLFVEAFSISVESQIHPVKWELV